MKIIFITGANKGIGFETARQLAQLGHFVYLGSRDLKKGIDAVKALNETDLLNVEAIEIDVADISSIKKAKLALESKTEYLDVLINNAGISGNQPQNLSYCNLDDLRKTFDTNYFGAMQVTQQFLGLLKKSGTPSIINVSSEIGSLTMQTSPGRNPNWDLYNGYGSSKTALNTLTILLSKELSNLKIRVNSVTPGYTATDLNQYKGIKTAEQGAKPIVKLAVSEDGSTGKFFKEGGEVPW